ncbi:MAG: C39 family peptidase, partial [bacterium]
GYYVEQHVLGEGIVGDKGSSSFDLVAKANDYKFDGSVINCSLSGLLNFLSEGKPVIARILNDAGNSGHFVVVTGYDQSLGLIYINDPDQPYRKSVYIDKFESLWNITSLGDNNNSSNLLVLVYPTASIATLAL